MPSGIITLIIVTGSMFALFIIISTVGNYYSLNRIKNKTVGQGQHGTARWATKKEIKRTYKQIDFQPDEWRTKAVDTYNEVLVLLKEKGLEKVDWAFMHGCFKYQMPNFLQHRLDLHDEEDYCKIVNKGIFIGHHHNFSEYKKIHCAGSLERWSFGQENEKGAFFVEELMNGEIYVEFIRNPCAQVYMDVIVDGLTSNEILSKIKKFDVDLHSPINIRLTTTSGIEVVNEFIDKYKYIYTEVKWKSKDLSKKGIKPVTQLVDDQLVFSKINLDFDTLETLMLNRLAEKYPEKISKLTYLFKDMLTDFRGKHGERS